MAFVPTPNGIEVVVNQTYLGEALVNVFNVSAVTPEDGFTQANVANLFIDLWQDSILPNVSDQLALNSVVARDISVADGTAATIVPTGTVIGGQNGAALPSSLALCITHRTARTGRSYRGRTYIAGLVEPFVTANLVSGTIADNIVGGFTALRSALATASTPLCIKSLRNNKVARTAGVLTPVTVSLARDLRVDNQRRRLPS